MDHLTEIIMVLLYIVLVTFIGWYFRKRAGDSPSGFYAAGREIGPIVGGISFAATYASGSAFMGALGARVTLGHFSDIWIIAGVAVAFVVVSRFIAPYLRKSSLITVPDFFQNRFGDSHKTIVAIIIAVLMFVYAVAQMKALGLVGQYLLGVPYEVGLLVGLIVIVYLALGGMYAIIWTSFYQSLFMGIMAVLFVIYAFSQFNWGDIMSQANVAEPFLFAIGGALGNSFNLSLGLVFMFGTIAMPHIIMRLFSSTDQKTATKTVQVGAAWLFLIYATLFVVPTLVIGLGLDLPDPDLVIMRAAEELFPPVLIGLVVVAIFSASMSSTDAQLMASASSLIYDIYYRLLAKKKMSDKKLALISRIASSIIGLLAIWVAFGESELILLVVALAMQIAGASLLVPLIGGIWWKRANQAGAIASSVGGFLTVMILHERVLGTTLGIQLPNSSIPGILGVIVSFVLFIVVSYITRVPSRESVEFVEKLHK